MERRRIGAVFFDLGDTLVDSRRGWIPGAKSVINDLRARHVRLGVISNTGDRTRDQLNEALPADFDWTVFDPTLVVLSSEVGVAKPDPEIFKKAVAASGLEAGGCLFCTEDLFDVLAAQSVGLVAARVVCVLNPPLSDLRALFDHLFSGGSAVELRGSAP
jgi:FMN phosphatase YigB (HAD superfamily)